MTTRFRRSLLVLATLIGAAACGRRIVGFEIPGAPLCGNGIVEAGEVCDAPAGAIVSCTTTCGTTGTSTCNQGCGLAGPCVGPPEICNGLDDNCDGRIDEGLYAPAATGTPITSSPSDKGAPALAAGLDQFLVLWPDDQIPTGVYGIELGVSGPLSQLGLRAPAEAATGVTVDARAAGAAWVSRGALYFLPAPRDSSPLPQVRLATTAEPPAPAIASDGAGRHLVVWTDHRDTSLELYSIVVDDDGSALGAERRLTWSAGESSYPAVAASGDGWGLVWADARTNAFRIYFLRLDALGRPLGGARAISDHSPLAVAPSVVWTGRGFGVVWIDLRESPGMYFRRLRPSGQPWGETRRVADGLSLCWRGGRLTWSGSQFGLVWEAITSGIQRVQFTRLNEAGRRIGQSVLVSHPGFDAECPQIAWSGEHFGVAWSDLRERRTGSPTEIYFNRLVCQDSTPTGGVE